MALREVERIIACNMAITRTSLVTLALLGVRDRALTLDQIEQVAAPLLGYLERRGVSGNLASLRDRDGLRACLDELVDGGAATVFDGGTEPVWAIAGGAALCRAEAFMTRAVLELTLPRAVHEAGDPLDALVREALRLCNLLALEAPDRAAFDAELCLLHPSWRLYLNSALDALALLAESGMLVAHRCLQPSVEAQYVVAERLATRAAVDRDRLLAECAGIGRQLLLQGRLHNGAALSDPLLTAALDVAAARGLLDGDGDRRAWREAIDDVLARLRVIEDLDATTFEDALDGIAS